MPNKFNPITPENDLNFDILRLQKLYLDLPDETESSSSFEEYGEIVRNLTKRKLISNFRGLKMGWLFAGVEIKFQTPILPSPFFSHHKQRKLPDLALSSDSDIEPTVNLRSEPKSSHPNVQIDAVSKVEAGLNPPLGLRIQSSSDENMTDQSEPEMADKFDANQTDLAGDSRNILPTSVHDIPKSKILRANF